MNILWIFQSQMEKPLISARMESLADYCGTLMDRTFCSLFGILMVWISLTCWIFCPFLYMKTQTSIENLSLPSTDLWSLEYNRLSSLGFSQSEERKDENFYSKENTRYFNNITFKRPSEILWVAAKTPKRIKIEKRYLNSQRFAVSFPVV